MSNLNAGFLSDCCISKFGTFFIKDHVLSKRYITTEAPKFQSHKLKPISRFSLVTLAFSYNTPSHNIKESWEFQNGRGKNLKKPTPSGIWTWYKHVLLTIRTINEQIFRKWILIWLCRDKLIRRVPILPRISLRKICRMVVRSINGRMRKGFVSELFADAP